MGWSEGLDGLEEHSTLLCTQLHPHEKQGQTPGPGSYGEKSHERTHGKERLEGRDFIDGRDASKYAHGW